MYQQWIPQIARQGTQQWTSNQASCYGDNIQPRYQCQRASTQARSSQINDRVVISPEVQEAIQQKRPVVALESTIITHGMPYPTNLETAQEVQQTVRENGALPATIALIDGIPHVGLTQEQLIKLSKVQESNNLVMKCSRKDLSIAMALGRTAGTTVAATMILAHIAGIKVFATGGIGGVHRGGQDSLDISADISELSRTPVAVVCAGIKSILDIPLTLESLETAGVTVATYKSTSFPAFFSPKSVCESPYTLNSIQEIADVVYSQNLLGLQSGQLFAVPLPDDQLKAGQKIENATQQALKDCDELGISGSKITPYLLGRVNELTSGESLSINVALIRNNAAIAAQVSNALSCK